jgi:hypothetical protein
MDKNDYSDDVIKNFIKLFPGYSEFWWYIQYGFQNKHDNTFEKYYTMLKFLDDNDYIKVNKDLFDKLNDDKINNF